ncbi:hypothetical protein QTP88_025485 [Uroleucon formosanum]
MIITMNTKKKWNVEDTCKLIELYQESPILWDATNLNYKNKFKKADALKDIGMQLGTDANKIDRKLKNVYSQYTRERRAYKTMNKSGTGRDFRPKWFGFCISVYFNTVDENIFERNEGNSIKNLQISDESNILAPVEFSQMATPKNLKYRKKFGSPDHLNLMKMKIELKRFLK